MGDLAPDNSPESGNSPAGSGAGGQLDPSRLSPADAARALTVAGRVRVTELMIRTDIEAGAPVNADGTINLVHYAAWLAREKTRSERSEHED